MPDLNKVSPSPTKTLQGRAVESHVAEYLEKQGFQLLHRNFRSRLGEIDLIGMHQNQLLFVEVRFRQNKRYGTAAESVDFRKQQKLIKAARFFLLTHPKMANCACRFDVVAVTLGRDTDPGDPALEIDWIKNAFC